jgi:hypothetical protein
MMTVRLVHSLQWSHRKPRTTSPELRPRDSWGDLINTYTMGTWDVQKGGDVKILDFSTFLVTEGPPKIHTIA